MKKIAFLGLSLSFFLFVLAACGGPVTTTGYGSHAQSEYGKVVKKQPLTAHTPEGSWVKGRTVKVLWEKNYRQRNNNIALTVVTHELQRFGADVNQISGDLIAQVAVESSKERAYNNILGLVVVNVTITDKTGRVLASGTGEARFNHYDNSKVYSMKEIEYEATKSAAIYAVRAAISRG